MTDERSTLGTTIRERRLAHGWSQEELAERISTDEEYVRQSEISRLEKGWVAFPRRDRLERLAVVLNVPLGELLARSSWADEHSRLEEPRSTGTTPTDDAAGDQDAVMDVQATRSTAETAHEQLQHTLESLRPPRELHAASFDGMYSHAYDIRLEA
jgi:transcriptional regulator with XRE-family HTH domain